MTIEPNKTQIKPEKYNQALWFIKILLGIGIFSIVVYAIRMLWSYDTLVDKDGVAILNQWGNKIFKESISFHFSNLQNVISFFGLGLLLAGSALTIGSLIGFLFAIPKKIINTDNGLSKTSNKYIANDNLVEVSDWLTKIIIGVSLTQLMSIPGYLYKFGKYVGKSIGGEVSGEVATISIVVYFAICGFLLAYLWTRIYFARILENSENGD